MPTDGRTYSRTVLEWSQVRPDYTLPTKAISYKPTELGGSARAVGAVGTHTEQLTSLCAVLHSDRSISHVAPLVDCIADRSHGCGAVGAAGTGLVEASAVQLTCMRQSHSATN